LGSLKAFFRRLAFCGSLCLIAAAPGYLMAIGTYDLGFDNRALCLGIFFYVVLCTVVAGLPVTQTLLRVPFVRRTLWIGYAAQTIFTLVFPLSAMLEWTMGDQIMALVEHLIPDGFVRAGPGGNFLFGPTFLIALMDGAMHVLILLVFMVVAWAIQAVKCKWPEATRGFPVAASEHKESAH
jgi:hypothetical protein